MTFIHYPDILNNKLDLGLGSLSLQIERTTLLSGSKSFLTVASIMVVPPGRALSAFEKLIKPFSIDAWTLLLVYFIAACIFVCVLGYLSREAYNFVISEKIQQPVLNMLVGIFGLSSHVLPKRNFSRYMLMQFLILCLVIRSIYQGKLFTMLQSELRESNVDWIDEVQKRDMYFYTYESMSRRMSGFKFQDRIKVIKSAELEKYMKMTLDANFDGIVFNYMTQVLYLDGLYYREYNYLIAREVFVTNQFVFYFQQNHFLVNNVDRNIELFRQSGLIDKWTNKYVDKRFLQRVEEEKSPQPLSFLHLSAVFHVMLIGHGFSFLVFMIELVSSKLYKSHQKR